MIQKLKNYYLAFGLKQTVLKIIRYVFLKCHIDKNGVYRISKKELKHIVEKDDKIIFISKDYYKDDLSNESSKICNDLNQNGFKIDYFYLLAKDKNRHKLLPLCEYDNLQSVNTKNIKNQFIISDDISSVSKYIKNNNLVINLNDYLNKSVDLLVDFFERGELRKKYFNKISIIVLNYNNKNVIFKCIDNLMKYNNYGYEIIIVDNGSVDGSYEIIKKKYKNIKLLKNINNGCSSGRNLGVKNSNKEYIMFLDSDQWPINDLWLDNYLEIVDNNFKGVIGWAAGWFNNKGLAFHTVDNFSYRYMPPSGLYRNDIGYLGTGGMFLEKKLFDKVKGFDVNYDPTCYEDTDFSLMVRDYGEEIIYCPYLAIEHFAHQTTKSGSQEHSKQITKNGNYFLNKWKCKNNKLLRYKK